MPKPIQRIEPLTSRPIPGTSTSTNRPKLASSSFQLMACQKLMGIIMVRPPATTPMAT
ncbi:hypothetical protein FQZ97_844900 [compost metagenome]